jgi:hypothetical protein
MSNTETASYTFTVKEGAPSTSGADDVPVWLMLEPSKGDLSVLRGGFLSLRLLPGAKIGRGKEVAKYLNANIAGVSFTRL